MKSFFYLIARFWMKCELPNIKLTNFSWRTMFVNNANKFCQLQIVRINNFPAFFFINAIFGKIFLPIFTMKNHVHQKKGNVGMKLVVDNLFDFFFMFVCQHKFNLLLKIANGFTKCIKIFTSKAFFSHNLIINKVINKSLADNIIVS